ncbi:MAG: hypothetical protein KJ834_15420, partial [Alphaproteobacteria bacterium]|nr:hypothetical protein [Alphaproteobacteria bacterium]
MRSPSATLCPSVTATAATSPGIDDRTTSPPRPRTAPRQRIGQIQRERVRPKHGHRRAVPQGARHQRAICPPVRAGTPQLNDLIAHLHFPAALRRCDQNAVLADKHPLRRALPQGKALPRRTPVQPRRNQRGIGQPLRARHGGCRQFRH